MHSSGRQHRASGSLRLERGTRDATKSSASGLGFTIELPALLELLYSARDRSRTVHAIVVRTNRQARELEVLRARGFAPNLPPIPPEEGEWGEPAELIEVKTEVWAARPDWLRWESSFAADEQGAHASVGVKNGELFWHRFDDREIHSNENRRASGTMTTDEELLLDPSQLLGVYRFDIGEEMTTVGRKAIRVEANRRPGVHSHLFGPLSDQLSLALDCERGVLLCSAVVVDSEVISVTEVRQIDFDVPVAPERFRPLR